MLKIFIGPQVNQDVLDRIWEHICGIFVAHSCVNDVHGTF